MSKFRKKPVVIEAEQFHYGKKPWPVDVTLRIGTDIGIADSDLLPCIRTLEGWHVVSDGDWIITGIKGERYPCKPDIFEATYEQVCPV